MNTSPNPHIQKTQKRQFPFLMRLLRTQSVVVAYYLNKLHITPHEVLFFRVIFFGGGSLFFFYSQDYIYNLIGLFLIALCYFFDLVDGDLARNHNMVTKMGGFLDGNFDAIVLNAIILTFTIKFLNTGEEFLYIIAGMVILCGTILSAKMSAMFECQFQLSCGTGSDILENHIEQNALDSVSTFFYALITPKGFPATLLSNFRDYLLLGVIFECMPFAILGFAIAINIRWISLFIFTAMYFHWRDSGESTTKIILFPLLKESESHIIGKKR